MTEDLPIKEHLCALSDNIGSIKGTVAEQHKQLDLLREELSILEYKIQDPFREVREYFQIAKTSFLEGFDKDCYIFQDQVVFLREQIDMTTQDKLKIVQTALKVNAKLREMSQDVGIEPPQMFMV